jgi:putative ABC transport system permease protein
MSVLVVGEVALALMLLIVAGLSISDLRQLQQMDPGFEAEGVLSYNVALPSLRYEDTAKQIAFAEEHLERVRALPGVRSAALGTHLPLSGHSGWFFTVEGAPPRGEDEPNPVVLNRAIGTDYFATLGVKLKSGRVFTSFDGRDEGSRAVIVNETFVRNFFAEGEDPLGRRINTGGDSGWMTIVGVSRDVKHYGADIEMRPGVYQPFPQFPSANFQIALNTVGGSPGLMNTVRAMTREMDAELPLFAEQSMRERVDQSLWTRKATSWLIMAFSTVALALAIAGIYGVISYSVGQRVQEISIRMAMGAESGQVLGQVLKQGMLLVSVGVVIGVGVALAGSRVVAGTLVGVSATDPKIYVGVAGILVIIAGLANFIPARRAASLDPMRALRGE